MTGRILSVLVAFILALNIGTAAVSTASATTYNFVWVFVKDRFGPAYWVTNTNEPYNPPGCDTQAAGASDGYVRCSSTEPGDSPDPAGAFDVMYESAPVSILDAP